MSRQELFDWTDRRLADLQAWWAEGASTAEIADRFGWPCTKNSVIGKAHRLKLPSRPSPIGKRSSEKRKPRASQPGKQPRKAKKVVLTLVPTPEPVPALPVVERAAAPEPPPTRFLPRKATDCCWPIGEPKAPGFRFCDAVALVGKPYCQEHYAIAYRPYRPKAEHLAEVAAIGAEIANRRGAIRMKALATR